MTDFTQLGSAGLQGWRTKVGDAVARPLAARTSVDEDRIRAVVGALFFVLAARYVVKTATNAVRQAREG